MSKLTDTQAAILQAASKRPDGNIEPLPSNINAGIKPRVIQGLLTRELITQNGDSYTINESGFDAIRMRVEEPRRGMQAKASDRA